MNMEEIIFGIIVGAGESRSASYHAIELSHENKFVEASAALEESKAKLHDAHRSQTRLIQAEAAGEKYEISILLIHSQDHLMTAQSELGLAEQIVRLNERVYKLESDN